MRSITGSRAISFSLMFGLAWLSGCEGTAYRGSDEEATEEPTDLEGPARVSGSLDEQHQSLEGFGAAVAWYQELLTIHPKKTEIYQVIFQDLGLDILRFRNRHQRSEESSGLEAEKEILEEATKSLGHPPRLLVTSWSPPASLKSNGAENCAGSEDCTLRKVDGRFDYEGFADYWLESLAEYQSNGIAPTWISIQNEPDFLPGSWEGCRFDPYETDVLPGYGQALDAVHGRLGELDSPPKLLGPETLGVHYNKVKSYLAALDRKQIVGVAHHLYESGSDGVWDWQSPGPDSYISAMQNAATAAGDLPRFQTEFQTDEDQGTKGGLETAWLIHNSLVVEDVAAFLYWDLVWGPGGYKDPETGDWRKIDMGMVTLDEGEYRLRDQYFAVRHYSRFTDPGDIRVGIESDQANLRVSAFRAKDNQRLTIVMLNLIEKARDVTLELDEFPYQESSVYLTEFESERRWVELGELKSPITMPKRSIATVVLEK